MDSQLNTLVIVEERIGKMEGNSHEINQNTGESDKEMVTMKEYL